MTPNLCLLLPSLPLLLPTSPVCLFPKDRKMFRVSKSSLVVSMFLCIQLFSDGWVAQFCDSFDIKCVHPLRHCLFIPKLILETSIICGALWLVHTEASDWSMWRLFTGPSLFPHPITLFKNEVIFKRHLEHSEIIAHFLLVSFLQSRCLKITSSFSLCSDASD